MRLDTLPIGARFRLTGLPEKQGTLLSLSPGGATVRYGTGRTVTLPASLGAPYGTGDDPPKERTVTFPPLGLVISRGTDVELISIPDDGPEDVEALL